MKVFLIVISALSYAICDLSHRTLTTRENEIRLGSCGDPMGEILWLATVYKIDGYNQVNEERERTRPRKTSRAPVVETTTELTLGTTTAGGEEEMTISGEGSTDETSNSGTLESTSMETSTKLTATTTARKAVPYETTNAVFISQTHLLLTSSWFLHWNETDESWHWKYNTTRVDDSVCKTNNKESFTTRSTYNYVMDYRGDWRKVEEIIFLRFCEFRFQRNGFLAVIVVNRTVPPIPTICLPKAIEKTDTLDVFRKESIRHIGDLGKVKVCTGDHGVYYNIIGNCTHKKRGSPMVANDQFGVQRLHGVVALDNQTADTFHHIIPAYMDEMCRLLRICGRDLEKIDLTLRNSDQKLMGTIDDDYTEQIGEPDILEYNGPQKQTTGIGLVAMILMFWLFE